MIVCVVQARNGSSRLPGKVLRTLPESGNVSALQHVVSRVNKSSFVDKVIIATTDKGVDTSIVALAEYCKVSVFAGSEDNVLERFYQAVQALQPVYVLRVT